MAEEMRLEDWALLEDFHAAPMQARECEPTWEELRLIEALEDSGSWLEAW